MIIALNGEMCFVMQKIYSMMKQGYVPSSGKYLYTMHHLSPNVRHWDDVHSFGVSWTQLNTPKTKIIISSVSLASNSRKHIKLADVSVLARIPAVTEN